ncbi:filamentous hemagglutinin N-terminal domain-containing protein [Enterobacter vonholyi]|jgi:filamentous haemagglutinin family N-terminal domain|uniref:filamentous hemagglutinin N-terminal domain-containing protein n=1 Tax=Enterobacter vonholyi TaxID=2797505 RepID=UPI0011EE8894|nr:filamentous hemagglutinin N-terminal domain-containing protein [Enterobacter vonholyi]KAA0514402.1 filamentous hemagglutinin N-terminal domain-containing protein [Enterobacter vonholyi]MCL5633073.1 filamentous hemagglutinin N-terminal domain-containing protein [Enterobacter vonholyi]
MKNKCAVSTHLTRQVLHAKLAPTCFATMLALGMIMPVHAAVVAGNTEQPGIHTNSNGTTIVDINKASAEGVSHNVYSEFNVETHGVILNNSGAASNTQLAGMIDGNTNMASGSAKVILNEVRSSDPSQLNGMIEVAGKSAQVIIANPSGITCDGCGFINTNHATLTTGTANFDANGNVTGLDISKGEVNITGKGMDTRAVQYTDIISRSVKVNAKLQANELNIITGNNRIDKKGRVQKRYDDSKAPELALDVSALGSMYANKIFMEGTDTGVGVRLDHTDLTANDTLSIDVNGNVENNGGHVNAGNAAMIKGTSVVNRNGQITSDGVVSITADEMVDNSHGLIKADMVNLAGKTTLNTAGSVQGNASTFVMADSLDNAQGEILSNGELLVQRASYAYSNSDARGINNTQGKIVAKGALSLDTTNIDNTSGQLASNASMNVTTRALNNENGLISAGNGWNTISANVLNNNNGIIQSFGHDSQLQLSGDDLLSNHNGTIHSEGSLSVNGALDNSSGAITADNDIFMYARAYNSDLNSTLQAGRNIDMTVTGTFQNAGTIAAGQDLALNIGSNGWNNYAGPVTNSGNITAKGHLAMQMNSSALENSGTLTADQMDLQLSDLNNSGSILSKNDINLNLNNLNNLRSGDIKSDRNITINASAVATEAGSQLQAGGDTTLNLMNNLQNDGEIRSANDINMFISGGYGYYPSSVYNTGVISAGNKLNAQMERINLINGGTLSAENGINITSNTLTNSGNITSAEDVQLNTYNGINNEKGGIITGKYVRTTGFVNNTGVINQTGTDNPDNNVITPDSNNTSIDNSGFINDNNSWNGNNMDNSTSYNSIKPNGTPEGNGVWENGMVFYPGDTYFGRTITEIVYFPGGYGINTAM